ncbi:hypothetical protein [Archangium lansingense]|uniref:Lipoprotein n=1 Tax=Archangium lansingense TaxID=2995310 RepID=A0ABT4AFS8_9BACT|nr:hypothetical protein [Archangium lansinium]MCY1080534.1 hypothetical protein [Archangium lansinium]
MSTMLQTIKSRPLWLLLLLAVLQAGCLAESEPDEVAGRCGPRDLTPECCLKQLPGQWERCTGSSEMAEAAKRAPSLAAQVVAAGTAVAVAVMTPQIGSAERRGVELAADLRSEIEKAIAQCARRANQEVSDYHFKGRSPSAELCKQVKVGEQTTWAAYLGLFKHEQAWPCLREALNKLIPSERYRLRPRFQFSREKGTWEFMEEDWVSQIVTEQGWKGLAGTIEPDIIILDEKGIIVRVYDLKFPCPETKPARWTTYTGRSLARSITGWCL